MNYEVVLYSTSGIEIGRLCVGRADLNRVTGDVLGGHGLIRLPDDDTTPYRLIPARNIGWIDITEAAK